MDKLTQQRLFALVAGFLSGLVLIGSIALLVGLLGYQKPFCTLSTAIELPNSDPPVPVGYPKMEIV